MPVVFVHGVPDTHRVWEPVLARLGRSDAITLSLPGFGTPVPPGFTATKDAYVDWLIAELARLPAPVDLVGHDWGSRLMLHAACLRPDLVRSWVGGGAPVSPDYVWHQVAQLWQTPVVGETVMAAFDEPTACRALTGYGVPPEQAAEAARHIDATMKDCILRLYRSARDVYREWGPALAALRAPGLVLWGELDPFAAPIFADRMGELTRARRVVRFPDCGHWWQSQRPDDTAREILEHWREVGG